MENIYTVNTKPSPCSAWTDSPLCPPPSDTWSPPWGSHHSRKDKKLRLEIKKKKNLDIYFDAFPCPVPQTAQ